MTLKEELEILRGEPIEVFTGDPLDIPCIETSDAEMLCKHPVVSVNMITYNHEPYIRQAIEGVMMQKTDFEFELIIGEDCSQDKTREICFEYQKRYPDKIRVLWWHENVSKVGGNSRRCRARCRGEFIALCEGDDYWIDPLKLQKQVDIMRKHPTVGLCFCGSKYFKEDDGSWRVWNTSDVFPHGAMSGDLFSYFHTFGHDFVSDNSDACAIMTATVMVRASVCREVLSKYEIFGWRLWLGDTTLWLAVSSCSDVFYLDDIVSTYRLTCKGACSTGRTRVWRDGVIVRAYYFLENKGKSLSEFPGWLKYAFFMWMMDGEILKDQRRRRKYLLQCFKCRVTRQFLFPLRVLPIVILQFITSRSSFAKRLCGAYYRYVVLKMPERSSVLTLYKEKFNDNFIR